MKHCLYSFLSRLALPGLMSLILLSPAIMRADTISTFLVSGPVINLSGMTLDSCANRAICPFSGMFQVETNNFGTVESSGLNFVFPGLPTFNILGFSQPKDPNLWIIGVSNAFDQLMELYFFTATPNSLIGFTGGPIVGGDVAIIPFTGVHLYVGISGSITPVPEPSSLVLLAGGIVLLVLGLTRFRKKSASTNPSAPVAGRRNPRARPPERSACS
jgi:hypothetical protein